MWCTGRPLQLRKRNERKRKEERETEEKECFSGSLSRISIKAPIAPPRPALHFDIAFAI
jgi:hypothetical protein